MNIHVALCCGCAVSFVPATKLLFETVSFSWELSSCYRQLMIYVFLLDSQTWALNSADRSCTASKEETPLSCEPSRTFDFSWWLSTRCPCSEQCLECLPIIGITGFFILCFRLLRGIHNRSLCNVQGWKGRLSKCFHAYMHPCVDGQPSTTQDSCGLRKGKDWQRAET